MNKSVVFYGERGIVNSIILDMKDDLYKQKSFLNCIRLADNSYLDWVDKLESMKYFVEPSFSEFGSPDLIIKAKTSDNKNYVIFVEAKTDTYEKSSVELAPTGLPASGYDGIGSKLNVQLSYKYRFVEALKNSTGKNFIVESNAKANYSDKNRRLVKESLVRFCFEFFKDIEKYYFVALTNDKNSDPRLFTPRYIPCIGSKWHSEMGSFGIFTYRELENKCVVSAKSGYYADAYRLMFE